MATPAWLSQGDVKLFYEMRGSGEPSLLFVHGGLGNHGHWAQQLEHFSKTHHVVALDLRGHGQSSKPGPPYSIDVLADDLASLCEHEGLKRPVVIGHSLGGLIALHLAVQRPDLPRAICAVESPIVPPATHAQAGGALLDQLRRPDYADVVRSWGQRMVPPGAPYAEDLIAGMVSTPQSIAVSVVEHMMAYDSSAAAASCAAPMLVIDGRVDRERLRGLCPHVVLGQTVGGGHFVQLDVPSQVNSMIEAFVRQLPPDRSDS